VQEWILGAVVALMLAALSVGIYFYGQRRAKLTEKDTIIIADFTNATGDPVFDNSLKTALVIALQQSPFIHVRSNDKVAGTLQLMTLRLEPSSCRKSPAKFASVREAKLTSQAPSPVWAASTCWN
jgi:hypothetical protein